MCPNHNHSESDQLKWWIHKGPCSCPQANVHLQQAPQGENNTYAPLSTWGDVDGDEPYKTFWRLIKLHYIDNADEGTLEGIVDDGQRNPELILSEE